VVKGDRIVIGEVMYLSFTYDHRVVDGGPAAQFLRSVKEILENPDGLAGSLITLPFSVAHPVSSDRSPLGCHSEQAAACEESPVDIVPGDSSALRRLRMTALWAAPQNDKALGAASEWQ